jgi:hypothetical protein
MHEACGHPVEEGWLIEEADAVDVGGDVVVASEHLASDLDVNGVDIVEQARCEEASDLEDRPSEDEDDDGAWAPGAGDGLAISSQLSSSQFSVVVPVICLFFYGAVGVEGLSGTFFEKDFVVTEQTVDFIAFVDGDEENFSLAFAPDIKEILWGEEDWRGIGEGAAEEH